MSVVETFSCFLIGTGSLMTRCAGLLLSRGHRIVGLASADPQVAHWAAEHGIAHCRPDEDLLSRLQEGPFDYLFSITNPQVLSQAVLSTPRRMAINYHDAPLPRYAGVHATSWALTNRETAHGITWHVMSAEVDAGEILKQRSVPIEPGETAFTLNAKCYEAAYDAFVELIDDLACGRAAGVPQDLAARTYFPLYRRPERGGMISWEESAVQIEALARALDFGPYENPLGRAKLALGGELYLFSHLEIVKGGATGPAGTIRRIERGSLQVATGTEAVLLRDLQTLEGQPVSVADLAARYGLREGARLPRMAVAEAAELTARCSALARHERFWAERLASLRACGLPYVRDEAAATGSVAAASVDMPIPEAAGRFWILDFGFWIDGKGESGASAPDAGRRDLFLLAAFAAYLARLTGSNCFDLGFCEAEGGGVSAGADRLFAPSVPLRVELERGMSFRELQARIGAEVEQARRRGGYARDLVVRQPALRAMPELRVENPWPVSFQTATDGAKGGDLTAQALTVIAPASGGACRWVYDPQRLDGAAIAQMQDQFARVLEAVAADPERRVADLPLLTLRERQQVVVDWNRTETPYPPNATIHSLFQEQAARTPGAVAVVSGDRTLTYRALDEQANQLAHYLRGLGVGPEARVGLALQRSPEMVAALLAILKAGAAYVPLDPAYPAARRSFMLADAQVSLLLSERAVQNPAGSEPVRVICLDDVQEEIDRQPRTDPGIVTRAEQLAYVIYTSGSTGTPKGVAVPHRGVVRLVCGADYARLAADEVFLQLAPLAFDASTFELWGALLNGARLVLFPPHVPSLDELGEALERYGVTTLWLTAGLFHQMAEHCPAGLRGLRQLLAGGDVLSPAHVRQAVAAMPRGRLINGYGPTENTTFSCCYPVPADGPGDGPLPIGRPIANTQAYVLDAGLQPVPAGVPGELYVGGDGLARGYLNRPALTAERFVPHPFSDAPGARLYRTGDRARWRADGQLEFLGRVDQQVKVRGFRIELGEIEAALGQCPAVRECAVVARDVEGGDKRLVAYLVASAGTEEPPRIDPSPGSAGVPARFGRGMRAGTPALPGEALPASNKLLCSRTTADPSVEASEIRSYLQARLPEYMVPSAFVYLEALPLNANGKVDRRALAARDVELPDTSENVAPPQTPAEEALVRIWREVLRRESVGVDENFFELGGDSILAIQIAARAQQAGLRLTPSQLFQHQTVAALAAAADDGPAPAATAEQGVVTGEAPLTPVQRWFFEQRPADVHHYNQAILAEVRPDLGSAVWEEAVRRVFAHHDSFRLRYTREDGTWRQFYAETEAVVTFGHVDLSDRSASEQQTAIDAAIVQAQSGLDLSVGPLARATYFDLGAGRPGRLLLVAHHLVVDGVSWRILLEDLQRVVGSAAPGGAGAHPERSLLPPRTTSYQAWSRRLVEHARSRELIREAKFWLAGCDAASCPLPRDFAERANTVASERSVRVSLTAEMTRDLLQRALAAHGAQINDLLLAALSHALAPWAGGAAVRVDVEGHGREAIGEDVELSRTVGWFTSIYPVTLDLEAARGSGGALGAVKAQLRRIPNRGIGYGLLRYQCEDPEIAGRMRALPPAEVSFNYLGQFDQLFAAGGPIGGEWEWCGGARSPRQTRSHLLSIDGQIRDRQLEMVWSYSDSIHRRETIERLAEAFMDALRFWIEGPTHVTRPDVAAEFPDVQLSPEKLELVFAELGLDSVPAD